VLFADEVRVECTLDKVGVDSTPAVDAKSAKIYLSETLSMNASWCTDLQSADPDCNAFNTEGERTVGSVKTSIGDFQQQNVDVTCVDSIADLQGLAACPTELAIATCADSTTGFMTFPQSYQWPVPCPDGSGYADLFSYSSAEGGGSSNVNLVAIGADAGAPGYTGDNTIPPVLPGWTAIVSTPDNQVNIWNFSDVDLVQVAFIHTRNNDDEVTGSKFNDTILGGSGADILNGYDGNDILQGGDNVDVLNGDAGDDLLLGYECNSINATCGSYLNNGSDDDILNGGDGDDCLDGGRGNDSLTGGSGSDAYVLFGNPDNDTIYGFESVNGAYDPSNPLEDVIVDTTGSAQVSWDKGSKKDDIPSICTVTTSGNKTAILDGLSQTQCNNVDILVVSTGSDLPAQCSGHPYSYY
jgi:Ca2+-binding RTX toxin-like protein